MSRDYTPGATRSRRSGLSGHLRPDAPADNPGVRVTTRLTRVWLVLLFGLAQVVAASSGPSPAAAADSAAPLLATWSPRTLTPRDLAGVCPTDKDPQTPCTMQRGVTYQTSVSVQLNEATQPLTLSVDARGIEVTAVSRATGADFTRQLAANQSEQIDVTVTIPESNPRTDRGFYLGKVTLQGGASPVSGSLVISVSVPKPRVSWGRLMDPTTKDVAPIQTVVGAGAVFQRTVTYSSTMDIADFAIRSTSDRVKVSAQPDTLSGGTTQTATLTFSAPIVNRRTRMTVTLYPAQGLQPVATPLNIRVLVLPAQVTWGPPQIRATLNAEEQKIVEKTLTVVSNFDVPGVSFRTQDIGLTPVLSPLDPVDLKAGVPQQVKVRLCPGYAPTTYFLGITAYQGSKPLNTRLQIKLTVEGDAANIKPLPDGAQDPCAAGL